MPDKRQDAFYTLRKLIKMQPVVTKFDLTAAVLQFKSNNKKLSRALSVIQSSRGNPIANDIYFAKSR